MASVAPSRDPRLDAEWEEWKKEFGKTYSPDEEGHRRALWEKSKELVEKHNVEYEQGRSSYSLGLNEFSDLTDEEHRKYCLGKMKYTEESPTSENVEEKAK
ncbi:Protein CTLA-2-beta [Cricetulus griseus]|uniref:Protein CTLA-2-beta n=1 Tax=Cricetulus griseus TaxID=10029 RepID=G3IGW0_CRIGR|nr:Protein CTLA-2-beta [Cricetulus griseus]